MRFRIQTIMMGIVIASLMMAMVVQGWQAQRREAILRARMEAMEAEMNFTMKALEAVQLLQKHRPGVPTQNGRDAVQTETTRRPTVGQ